MIRHEDIISCNNLANPIKFILQKLGLLCIKRMCIKRVMAELLWLKALIDTYSKWK